MNAEQTLRSSAEISTRHKAPMVKQNSAIPTNLQNHQTQLQSSTVNLISPGPRFLSTNINSVDGTPRFQYSGGPPPVRHVDSRSQLNVGGPQGQYPSSRPSYGLPFQRGPPPRNIFFGRPPQLNLSSGGPPPQLGLSSGGPPPQLGSSSSGPPPQLGSSSGGPPPQLGSSSGGPPPRFLHGQSSSTGPQGQPSLSARVPQSFNQPGFTNRPPLQSPSGIPSNDPRLPNRGLLQRNNSVGGIAAYSRFSHPNFPIDQRQQQQNNDLRNQPRPQLSIDRMADIDVNQLQRLLSSTSLQIDDSDVGSWKTDNESEDEKMNEERQSINSDVLTEVENYDLEQKTDAKNNYEIQDIELKNLSKKTTDIKVSDIELPAMKVYQLNSRLQSGFEKSKELAQSSLKTSPHFKNFIDGQIKMLSSATPFIHHSPNKISNMSMPASKNHKASTFEKKMSLADEEIMKVGINSTNISRDRAIGSASILKKSSSNRLMKTDAENDSGVDETTQRREAPRTNGISELSKQSKDNDKKSSTTGSPVKSPSKSIKSLPRTPDSAPPTTVQEKKKVPMNKVQVGAVPSPNLQSVRSKIGSLDNSTHKPGGGKVKIENRKLDFSKAQPKIAAKNDKYIPSGGDKKIQQVKLQWNAKPKIGSLDNAAHKPGGGDKKIETVKLDFKDKAKPKVGSKENAKHVPGGGSVKIETQKIDIKAESKIGSLDNVKHKPGGGDKKIFDDKIYLRHASSNVESFSGIDSQSPIPSGTEIDKNGLPISDKNINQEC